MLVKKSNPSYMYIETEMKQEDGKGQVTASVRIEGMELENEKIMAIKDIEGKMAEEIERLLNC